ncbi:MAG: CocE/NonD family hydrolase C-terminal non-catalytic domain-containing protein, partial [Nitratireductor sp.]
RISYGVLNLCHRASHDHPQDIVPGEIMTITLRRVDWTVRTETFTTMHADREYFFLSGRIEAYENEKLHFTREFANKIKRNFI